MKCSCPKCKADITEEFPDIPPEGIFLTCPECQANFNLQRESFARRALHKEGEISCAECGSHPGPSIYCQNCHAIYPDYLIVESSSATKKQLGKVLNLLNAFKRISIHIPKSTVSTQTPQKQPVYKWIRLPSQPLQLVATLLILTALIGGSGVYYYLDRIESSYMNSYIKALLVIHSSEEYNNKVCDKILAEWKAKSLVSAPKPAAADQTFLTRGVKEADAVIKTIGIPPKKFIASNEALTQLYGVYKKHLALTVAPDGTPESFIAASRKLNDEFRKSATGLKNSLPEKLEDKLAESKKKYKQLQEF